MMRMMTRWSESWAELSCDDDDDDCDDVDDDEQEEAGGESKKKKSNNPNLKRGEQQT